MISLGLEMDVLDFRRDLNFHQKWLGLMLTTLHESVLNARQDKRLGPTKRFPHGTLAMRAKKSFEFWTHAGGQNEK